jgi:hypothetical protein
LCDTFPVKNVLKQGDGLLLLVFKFAVEYDIGKVQKPGGIKIDWDTLLLVCGEQKHAFIYLVIN